ncbi:TnsA endonuclease N-terminal domain-containing protein [Collimonas sp.]|jgi:hypothetical protein|uniref:TnsA endonuclease N-terminal domain-containing protein n=1 Tax=Collimonas sp. TaxID=1963772 RepID=UPI002C0C8FE8|nr:TnsA endonuclease N-terminal domain-containing protein [Collimonas sp.]HWW05902.1 TnsA endonuclease N-terminal domain-containing protein [Collimonas sp.]
MKKKSDRSRGMPNQYSGAPLSPRAREPIGRSFGLVRGKFPSRKIGRMVHWESQLERDAVKLFEFSSGISAYREQPMRVYYGHDGKTRRYTPDFEITLHTGEIQFIEVKPLQKTLDPQESARLARIQDHFDQNGNTLRVITEVDIRQKQLLENLDVLFRRRRKTLCAFDRRTWRKRFGNADTITFDDAVAIIGNDCDVWHLIEQEILICDLRDTVHGKTILTVTKEGEENAKLYI